MARPVACAGASAGFQARRHGRVSATPQQQRHKQDVPSWLGMLLTLASVQSEQLLAVSGAPELQQAGPAHGPSQLVSDKGVAEFALVCFYHLLCIFVGIELSIKSPCLLQSQWRRRHDDRSSLLGRQKDGYVAYSIVLV